MLPLFIIFTLHVVSCQALKEALWNKANEEIQNSYPDNEAFATVHDVVTGKTIYGFVDDDDKNAQVMLNYAHIIDSKNLDDFVYDEGVDNKPKDLELNDGVLDFEYANVLEVCVGVAKNDKYIIYSDFLCETENARKEQRTALKKAIGILKE